MFQSFPCSSSSSPASTNHYNTSSSSPSSTYDLPSYFASYSSHPLHLQTHTKQMQDHEATAAAAAAGGQASRYSPEERKERIERYRSKRNLRNFQKKITYECRKTLADSRPRVRGRFAKNAETESETDTAESSNGNNNANADNAWWHMEPDHLINQDQFQAQSESGSDTYCDDDLWAHFVSDFSANI